MEVSEIKGEVFDDARGYLIDESRLIEALEFPVAHRFTSMSRYNVVRGFHFQSNAAPQHKAVLCLSGHIEDIVIDIRANSPDFAKAFVYNLGPIHQSYGLIVPHGYAHGFRVMSEEGAVVQYLTSSRFSPSEYRILNVFDESIDTPWNGLKEDFILSSQDKAGKSLLELQRRDLFL